MLVKIRYNDNDLYIRGLFIGGSESITYSLWHFRFVLYYTVFVYDPGFFAGNSVNVYKS